MAPRVTKLALFLFALLLSACSGSAGNFIAPSASLGQTHTALVIGAASGTAYSRIHALYSVAQGTGSENPAGYDMVVFDCNATSPQALQSNGIIGRFLAAGKAVVLLNNTDAHREAAFKGVLFAHKKGNSAGSIVYVAHNGKGLPSRIVELDFPLHVVGGHAGAPLTVVTPTASQLSDDTDSWIAAFQARFTSGDSSNINAPTAQIGQTVASFDDVQPVNVNMNSELNTLTPGYGLEFCGNITSPNGWGSCNGQHPTITDSLINANFETMFNVLLEPNGTSYSYKIISRQFAFLNTAPFPGNPNWSYGFYMADSLNGTNNPNIPLVTMLGFNLQAVLSMGPEWSGMTVTEAQPTATNGSSSLTTSSDHSESVGLSATGGIQGGGVGLFGVNWSDTWDWSSASAINISDWSNNVTSAGGSQMAFSFWASGNTADTLSNVQNAAISGSPNGNNGTGYNPPGFTGLRQQAASSLNALQVSGLTTQDEASWQSGSWTNGSTPAITGEQTFDASASFDSGEVYQMPTNILGNQYNYGNISTVNIPEQFAIDFDSPTIAPPNPAPWTLTFGSFNPQPQQTTTQVTGTLTLSQPASTATTVNLSYVVQPQQSMIVQPATNSCPGNTTSFVPSNGVLGSPPLSVTVPAGKTSQTFTLTTQLFNADTYNIQVVAWLPTTSLGGRTITNPQSAVCLTPPNVIP